MAENPRNTTQRDEPRPEEPRREREREVIVTDRDGGRGSNVGAVIAAIVGAVVVLVVAWLLVFDGGGGESGDPAFPDEVDVDIDDGGGAGGGDAGGGAEGGGGDQTQ